MERFTIKNWNTSQYINENRKVIISLICDPKHEDVQISYAITMLDQDNNEIFQQEYNTLDAACDNINQKYAEFWEYYDLSKTAIPSGGCGSCVAH